MNAVMSQRISLCLCLVVLLCLPGCNALSGGETSETPMVTPASVPTNEPMSAHGLPPGVTEQGVVDPIALGRAHEAVLNETSYTVIEKFTVKYTNGTLLSRTTETRQVVAPTERYYVTIRWYRPNTDIASYTVKNKSIWSDGERVLVAISDSQTNETTYQYYQSLDMHESSLRGFPRGEQLYNLFYAIDTEIDNYTTHNGTTLYRITATEIKGPDTLLGFGNVTKNPRNITFHAVIDSRGLVHKYKLSYITTFTTKNYSTPIRIVRTARYTKIGNTTVERPPWYSKANRTTPVPLSEIWYSTIGENEHHRTEIHSNE